MKRWTRKLLAGLLSFGMLLQVASPLSALAAGDVGSDTAELEVTLTSMYGGTPETQQINPETTSIALGGKTINVAYNNGTYTLSGDKIGSYSTASSATDEITIRGVNSGKDRANVKLAIIIHGNLVVTDIHDLEVTKRVSVQNSVTCTGKVTMTASMLAQAGLIVKAGGDVILTGTDEGITIGENDTTAWGAEITSGGDVLIENDRGSTPVSGGILVHAAKNVTIKSSSQFALIRGSEKADITADTLTIISTNSNVGGPITFTPRSGSRDGYVIATGDSDTAATAVQLESKNYSVREKYLYIGPGTPENTTPDNAELKITAGDKEYRIDPKDISEYGKEYTIGYDTFFIYYHSEYDEFDIYGTVPDGTQIEGIGTHRPALQMTASTAGGIARPLTYGSLTIKNMGDVDLNGVIHENLTIENVKDVSSGVVGYAGSGNLIIDGAENVKYLTHVFGTIDINCTGEVNIYGSCNGSVSDGANITAKSLTMKNTDNGTVGKVNYTSSEAASDYVVMESTTLRELNGTEYDNNYTGKYLYIGPKTDTTTKAGSLTFSNSGTGEAYSLIRYKDNRVAWKDDKKPDGIDYAFYDNYDSTGNTYTLYGTLSLPSATWIDVRCNYENPADYGTDSVTFNGGGEVAINAGVYIYDANNVTIKTSGGSAAVVGFATIRCSGNVEITNSGNGTALGYSDNVGDGLLVYSGAKDVTVTANSSKPLVGDASLSNSGNVTLTNPSGPIANAYIKVSASEGDVKITGNSSEGLARFNCRPDYQKNTINAKSVTMYNEGGQIGKTIVQVPSTEGYKYVAGESADDAGRIEKALELTETTYTGTDKYLYVGPGTPAPTPEHHHTLGDWEHDETNHWKTCSGCHKKVGKAPHNFGSNGICECGYKKPATTPDHQHTASTEWKHDDTYHWHGCTTCEKNVQLDKAEHSFGEDGNAEKCEKCGFENPGYVAPAPDNTGTVDSGSDAGGAVAAVLMGGAAVWGGYEIATRVILHNILPEGTAIPANRGQLALLVWNNAGRPAPVNEPAFVDMDDADMAKAAQWCVEQGIMEAKTAETFKPEGWTPKLKVIEVWNKAFPKQ